MKTFVLDGDKFKPRKDYTKRIQGGNGFGLGLNNVSFTLSCVDRHMVALCQLKQLGLKFKVVVHAKDSCEGIAR